jgi:hypothetical protein
MLINFYAEDPVNFVSSKGISSYKISSERSISVNKYKQTPRRVEIEIDYVRGSDTILDSILDNSNEYSNNVFKYWVKVGNLLRGYLDTSSATYDRKEKYIRFICYDAIGLLTAIKDDLLNQDGTLQYGTIEEIWQKIYLGVTNAESGGLGICPNMFYLLSPAAVGVTYENQIALPQVDLQTYSYNSIKAIESQTNLDDGWQDDNTNYFFKGFHYSQTVETGWFYEWLISDNDGEYNWYVKYIRIYSNGMVADNYYVDSGVNDTYAGAFTRLKGSYLKVTESEWFNLVNELWILDNEYEGEPAKVTYETDGDLVNLIFNGNISPSKLNYGEINNEYESFEVKHDSLNILDLLSSTLAVRRQYMNVTPSGDISFDNIRVSSDDTATVIPDLDIYESTEGRIPLLEKDSLDISVLSGEKDIYENLYYEAVNAIFSLVRTVTLACFSYPYALNLLDKITSDNKDYIINSLNEDAEELIYYIEGWR